MKDMAENNQTTLYALSADKQKLTRKDYKRSFLGSEIEGRKSWNLTPCTNTQERSKVRTVSRIWQRIIKPLSMRWAQTKNSLHKIQQLMSEIRQKKLQILELTCCKDVPSCVHSHPKFTCQTQSISGSHTWAPTSKNQHARITNDNV